MTNDLFGKNYTINQIRYCQYCGEKYSDEAFCADNTGFKCLKCGQDYFATSNPAICAVIPLKSDLHKVLINIRAREPEKGKWETPGGFFRYHESAEEAAKREIKEELNISVEIERILISLAGDYKWKGKIISVLMIAVLATGIEQLPIEVDKEEIGRLFFLDLNELEKNKENFAFIGEFIALTEYKKII